MAADIFDAIESCCKTSCGYTSLKNVKDHRLDNRMESFFLAETIKYLYLIFDEKNFLHSNGEYATEHQTSSGSCFLHTSYLYNTEAHPVDIGALDCCSSTAFYQGKCTKNSEEQLKRFFHGKSLLFRWKNKRRTLISRIGWPTKASNMSDIGRIIDLVQSTIQQTKTDIKLWENNSKTLSQFREEQTTLNLKINRGEMVESNDIRNVDDNIDRLDGEDTLLKRQIQSRIQALVNWCSIIHSHVCCKQSRDTCSKITMGVFAQVVSNIDREFHCGNILNPLPTVTDSTEKREFWEQLRVECFARLFTYAYTSSFVLALTELFVSATNGQLYSQSSIQPSSNREHQITTTAGEVSTISESSNAESIQEHCSLHSGDVPSAGFDIIRYTADAGMNCLIDDVRTATQAILSRIPLEQMLDIGDLIWYCNDIRRQIEKIRYYAPDNQQPLLKYLRSNSFVPSRTDSDQPATTTTASSSSSYSFSDVLSSANSSSTTCAHPPPSVLNVQQQFQMKCIELIESMTFQRALLKVVEKSFDNIYEEFARELAEQSTMTTSQHSSETNLSHSTILTEPKLSFAKIVPISDNIYSTLTSREQLMLHFRGLACQHELREYMKHAYNLLANQSLQSASRTADSFSSLSSSYPTSSLQSSLQSNLSSFLQSFTSS